MLKFNGWKIIYFSTLLTMSTGGTTTNVDINNIDIPDEKVDSSENDNSGMKIKKKHPVSSINNSINYKLLIN